MYDKKNNTGLLTNRIVHSEDDFDRKNDDQPKCDGSDGKAEN